MNGSRVVLRSARPPASLGIRPVRLEITNDPFARRYRCFACLERAEQCLPFVGVFDACGLSWFATPSGRVCLSCLRSADLAARLRSYDVDWPLVVVGVVPSAGDVEAARAIEACVLARAAAGVSPVIGVV